MIKPCILKKLKCYILSSKDFTFLYRNKIKKIDFRKMKINYVTIFASCSL